MVVPFFSIIIATYNSEETLAYTLQSIQKQQFDQDELEVLVVDGGSTDGTRAIAKRYHATILENPKKLPEYAKAVGVHYAHGRYVMRMDSDEEFSYPKQLWDKKDFLIAHPEVKMLLSNGYIAGRKEICGISAQYMNLFGDPFSYIIYQPKIDKYDTYRKNIISREGKLAVMRFEKTALFPLADSATSVLSLEYMKEQYPTEYDSIGFTCSAYDRIIADTGLCGIIKGDNIRHNCKSSFPVYLSKLRFRVINNLFHKEESGFSAREGSCPKVRRRKLLFCLYAAIVPFPVLDSIRLAVTYKEPSFLLHFVYLYYVCLEIVMLGLLRFFGRKKTNESYG